MVQYVKKIFAVINIVILVLFLVISLLAMKIAKMTLIMAGAHTITWLNYVPWSLTLILTLMLVMLYKNFKYFTVQRLSIVFLMLSILCLVLEILYTIQGQHIFNVMRFNKNAWTDNLGLLILYMVITIFSLLKRQIVAAVIIVIFATYINHFAFMSLSGSLMIIHPLDYFSSMYFLINLNAIIQIIMVLCSYLLVFSMIKEKWDVKCLALKNEKI